MGVTSPQQMMVTQGPGVRFIRGGVARGGGIITCFSRLPSLLSSCGGNFTTTDDGDTGARGEGLGLSDGVRPGNDIISC